MPSYAHPRLGEVRPSQVVFSYGVGALVDLPHLSALVAGLDDWSVDPGVARVINEERLLNSVRWQLGSQVQKLLSPPAVPPGSGPIDPFSDLARIGVPVAIFPRWMFCPKCQRLAPLSSGLFSRKDDVYHPERTRYLHINCQKDKQPPVVPARFLVACENGHLDDFPWIEFVHRGPTNCEALLRMIEYGPSGEARDLSIHCDTCDAERRVSDAFGEEGRARMPQCRARRPHLRDYDDQPCELQSKAILVGASNLWFADVITVLAIPTESNRLAQLVEDKWATLQQVPGVDFIVLMRSMTPNPFGDFIGFTDTEIWEAIQARKQQSDEVQDNPADLKRPEWQVLSHPESAQPSKDFQLKDVGVPPGFEKQIAKVVLVERLREVRALLGFTRIDGPGELGDGPGAATDRRMPLARQAPAWVPAAEVRGEGIFIQLNEHQLQQWLECAAARRRAEQFYDAHYRWRHSRGIPDPQLGFPGLRFVLLHSLAHALMRQFVLECGYTAASVRERIYSRAADETTNESDPMAGILIYTAAPDSEGTLGGLVRLGEPAHLGRLLRAALRDAVLCASDPLCAEHPPSQDGITLHAAACHACMFAPETSCERGNKYLDRSVLVPTVERHDLAFFEVAGP